jgi:hypothetical protein
MTFLSPGLLWGLLALIPIAAIFFLKVRPRRKQTNAFFLWQKVFEEKKSSALFRRLRDLFSLILMLLAAAAIVFAMSRPRVDQDDGRDLLVVVDISASMSAGPQDERGIDLALQEAEGIVTALNGTRRMALASFADKLEFVSHLSDSPRDLLQSVRSLETRDVPVSENARRTLNQYAGGDQNYRVILLTDGHGGLEGLDEKIEVMRLGEPMKNAGLVEADFGWIPGKANTAGFFYRIASSFTETKQAELELRNVENGGIARLLPITLEPGLTEAKVLEIGQADPGKWVASLNIVDDFLKDNEIEMVLPVPKKIPVRVSAKQSYFFQRCVEAFDLSGGILRPASEDAELMLAQGAPDGGEPALVFGPDGESPYWTSLGDPIEVLAARVVVEGHPVLKHLDLDGLPFIGARAITPPDGAIILAKSESGVPLIYKSSQEGRTAIVVNLDPTLGDFFLSPWFPVLVHDAARHLKSREGEWRAVYPTGTVVTVPDGGELTKPGGEVIGAGPAELDERGLFTLALPGQTTVFGASLLHPGESLLDDSGPPASAQDVASGKPPALWLLIIALIIIAVESVLYHRRKLG